MSGSRISAAPSAIGAAAASPEPQPWATPSSGLATPPGSAAEDADAQESAGAVHSLESEFSASCSPAAGWDAASPAAALQQLPCHNPDTLPGLDPQQAMPAPARQLQGSDNLPVGALAPDDVPSPPVRPPASPTPSPKAWPPDSASPSVTPFDERITVSAEPFGDGSACSLYRRDEMHAGQVRNLVCSTSLVCSLSARCATVAGDVTQRKN